MCEVPERWGRCTVVMEACTAATEQGGITNFNNWRLTDSKTSLISLKTNSLESKEYIAYLCQRNTLYRQKLELCLCLDGLVTCCCLLCLPGGFIREKISVELFWDGLLEFGPKKKFHQAAPCHC